MDRARQKRRELMDLIYGSALWYAATKVNCHHLAERLSADHSVLFVESVGARAPRMHEWRRLLPRLLRALFPLRRVAPRIWLFSPLPLPFYRREGLMRNSSWVGWQVRVLLALWRRTVDAAWIFHPMGLGTARRIRARGIVYYCIDDHSANPGVDTEQIRTMERNLVREANYTVATAKPLADRLGPDARRVTVVPNVADTELFARDFNGVRHPVLAAIDSLPRPRLGYLGNLASYKIDIQLVYELAHRRPEWTFVLAGPRNMGDTKGNVVEAGAPPNVAFVGPIPFEYAPAAMDRFDVCLLPSARHEVMSASFPLKFFEYLMRGKPVVARRLPTLEPYSDWFIPADNAEEFERAIKYALGTDSPEAHDARREFASRSGWTEKMESLRRIRAEAVRVEVGA
jgi:glycosyltransferase involved in cell wall biosynthesis